MKVYIELLFLDNLIMNFIILYFSGRFAHIRLNYLRLTAGAAAGGVYACFMFPLQGMLSLIPVRVLVSLIMCAISFYSRSRIKATLKSVLYLYIITFIMGGAAFAFINLSSSDYLIKGGIILGNTVLRYVLFAVLVSIVCISLFRRLYSVHATKQLTYDIIVGFLGKQVACRAYMDTGNALKEPFSGLPVIIMEKAAIKGILPETMNCLLEGADPSEISNEPWVTRLRILPCKSIEKKQETIYGFKPDKILLKQNNEYIELEAVIAVTNDILSEAGSYHALLGPEVLV